jgi:cytoskeletal protein CcmA (bactofilin family)
MWRREEAQERAGAQPETSPEQDRRTPATQRGERATIGRSITIRGEVTGDEDLLIQGRVEGSVNLEQHAVTVGPDGEVKADIGARVVTIEGKVEGDVQADEQVIVRSSGRLQGDITSPRVMLEDGAYFRGGVDMTDKAGAPSKRAPTVRPTEPGTPRPAAGESTSAGSGQSASGKDSDATRVTS